MSDPGSIMLANERVYRFISDPSHRENLSGRVRAACLTCRKKKIKCSGEINCRTCREKGLVCEGLPKRKKPRRESVCSSISEKATGKADRKKKSTSSNENNECPPKRPTSSLKAISVASSSDSGYLSAASVTDESALSPTNLSQSCLDDVVSIDELDLETSHQSFADEDSPTSFTCEPWSIYPDKSDVQLAKDSTTEQENQQATISNRTMPIKWAKPETCDPHWPNNNNDTSCTLNKDYICAAIALEEQAQELRRLAAIRNGDESNPIQTRRQTIAFPVNSSNSLFDYNSTDNTNENDKMAVDDATIGLPERTPRTGQTSSNPLEASSWWDISPDMIALLGRGLSQAQAGHEQALFPLLPDESPSCAQPQQQQQHQNQPTLDWPVDFINMSMEDYFLQTQTWLR